MSTHLRLARAIPRQLVSSGVGLLGAMLADSPRAVWMMNEPSGTTLADSGSSGLPMTITGSPTAYAQSPAGGPVRTGISWPANVAVTAITAANVETGSPSTYALEAWLYMTALPAAAVSVLQIQVTTTQYASIRLQTTGVIRAQMQSGGGSFKDSGVLSLNTWHHAVLQCAPAGFYLRIDKVSTATTAATVGLLNGKAYSHAGQNSGAGALIIGPCAYYNAAVTDARFDAHYDAA